MTFKYVLIGANVGAMFRQVIICTAEYYTINFDVLYHLKLNFRTVLNIKELLYKCIKCYSNKIPLATL